MSRPTLAQRLGFGAQRSTTTKPKAPKPEAAPREISRGMLTGIDARQLSPDDYERRLAQLGLSAPSMDHRRLAPPIAPEVQRQASRKLDRAERRAEVAQWRADHQHAAEVAAGAIDARAASPEDVRARLASLGCEPEGLMVRPVGRELEPRADVTAGIDGRAQREADREVARAVHRASQLGQPFDAKKLTPGELRALLELRGAGL